MNRVELYGPLRDRFGTGFELDVLTPAEAFRAMVTQLPEFLPMIREGDYFLVREFKNGMFALREEHVLLGMNNSAIHLLPCVEGADRKGIGKMVLGVAFIAGAVFLTGGAAGVAIAGISLKTAGLAIGMSLLLGGAALLLAPTPKLDTDGKSDQSFLFSGDINTAAQNLPVPVTYGYDRVRPIPIASRILTNEYTVGAGETLDNPPNGVGGGGSFPFEVMQRLSS